MPGVNGLGVYWKNPTAGRTLVHAMPALHQSKALGLAITLLVTPAAAQEFGPSDGFGSGSPQLATDGAGTWIAVGHNRLLVLDPFDDIVEAYRSTDNGTTWATQTLSTGARYSEFNHQPSIATDQAGNWVAVWSGFTLPDFDALEIWTARSSDGGITWTDPALLAEDATSYEVPKIATGGNGTWGALWTSRDAPSCGFFCGTNSAPEVLVPGAGIVFARSTDAGASWSTPTVLSSNPPGAENQRGQKLATDGAGTWLAVWMTDDTVGTDWDLLFSVSTDDALTWSVPAPLNTNAASDTGTDSNPDIGFNDGTWITAWNSNDPLGGTLGSDYDVLYATSTDGGVTWSAPSALAPNAASASGDDRYPSIRADGPGAWLAAWTSDDSLGGTLGTDWDILKSRSDDDGATWSSVSALNWEAATDASGIADTLSGLARSDAGDWVAAWSRIDTSNPDPFSSFLYAIAASTDFVPPPPPPPPPPVVPSIPTAGLFALAALLLALGALRRRKPLG